jgi:hypothetical protein
MAIHDINCHAKPVMLQVTTTMFKLYMKQLPAPNEAMEAVILQIDSHEEEEFTNTETGNNQSHSLIVNYKKKLKFIAI